MISKETCTDRFPVNSHFLLFTEMKDQTIAPSNMTTSTSNAVVTVNSLRKISIVLHCIIFVVGVVGNGLVIFITGLKMKSTVNTIWFLNLAVADFLFSYFLIFNIIHEYREFDWLFGKSMCFLSSLVTLLNMFASTFLLTAISLDRCLSTWLVVWSRTKRTVLKARIICLLIWLASVACSLPLVISRKTFLPSPQQTLCIHDIQDLEIQEIQELETYKRQVVYCFVVGFLLPFIIISATYVAIGVRVKRLRKNNKLKPFRIILTVILAFFFCWLPFYVHKFLEVWLHEMDATNPSDELASFEKIYNQIGPSTVNLVYLNSRLNPFLYIFMCEDFQKKLKQSLVLVFENTFAEEQLSLF